METHEKESSVNPQPRKRAYRPPKLIVYGDIRELTQSVGGMGMLDGGAVGGMKRTSI